MKILHLLRKLLRSWAFSLFFERAARGFAGCGRMAWRR
ncbi:hypothetical protein S1OALGB6SA_365 [Olavius algarvensis spirochete endosymbiont]|nr:MAG: hypothetical protein [Olavius algarvensis spirochete endosymbiont]VDA99301.1 hypothetical protein S1OALGB6SA_365 [Olavius algarvensis spirochete endosymbiont]